MGAILATSCADEDGFSHVGSAPDDDGISVSIALAGQKTSETRGNEGDGSEGFSEEFGTAAENHINKDNLYVMTFSIPEGETVLTGDSELLEVLWAPAGSNGKTDSSVSSSGGNVYLKTKLDASIAQYESQDGFCIVAVANLSGFEPYMPNAAVEPEKGMKFSEFAESARYSFKGTEGGAWSWQPDISKNAGIPLFGVKTVNLNGYNRKVHNEWNPYPLTGNGNSTVWMLRAFAKVTVSLSDELKNLVLNGEKTAVKISSGNIGRSYAADFRLIPELSRMQDFSTTGETGQVNTAPDFSVTSPSEPAVGNILRFNVAGDGESACLYLPEDILDADHLPKIRLTLDIGGYAQKFEFDFKRYPKADSTGESDREQPLCWQYVLRNHSYRFVISLDFKVISVVADGWGNAFDNEFEFG